jgi:hypothetical protein
VPFGKLDRVPHEFDPFSNRVNAMQYDGKVS